jgi:broad specificity phosphatase PhoE
MVTAVFESHAATLDNEKGISSGHGITELSPTGIKQAEEMSLRYKDNPPDAVFCADLPRMIQTAEYAFKKLGIKRNVDSRLRGICYGKHTKEPSDYVKSMRKDRVSTPYPQGESYSDVVARVKPFIEELKAQYDDKTIVIIGNFGILLSFEYWVNGVPPEETLQREWPWKPSRMYFLK